MAYHVEKELDDNWTIYAQAVDASGAATNVTGNVSYLIYEEEGAAPILAGIFTQPTGVPGLYSEQIAVTAANGFEEGKDYVARMSAVIGGTTTAMIATLTVQAAAGGGDPSLIADAVWDESKAAHTGDTTFGNMAADLDNLEFEGREG